MIEKADLYFNAGATEVWIIDLKKRIHFHTNKDTATSSRIASNFPDSL